MRHLKPSKSPRSFKQGRLTRDPLVRAIALRVDDGLPALGCQNVELQTNLNISKRVAALYCAVLNAITCVPHPVRPEHQVCASRRLKQHE